MSPQSCTRCPNLEESTTFIGSVVFSCLLEKSVPPKDGSSSDEFVARGPTVQLVSEALLLEGLDPGADENKTALNFRKHAFEANEECPIMTRIEDLFFKGNADQIVDLSPPGPLMTRKKLEEKLGSGSQILKTLPETPQ